VRHTSVAVVLFAFLHIYRALPGGRLGHLVAVQGDVGFNGVQVEAIVGLFTESKLEIVVLVVNEVRLGHDCVLHRNVRVVQW